MSNKKSPLLASLRYSFLLVLIFWIIQGLSCFGLNFSHFGILPRSVDGLWGIITAPFIHGDLNHLIANTIPFFILSFLLFFFYKKRAGVFLVLIWITAGLLTWVIGREAWHIGVSGVIYGLATFLVVGGFMSRNWKLIILSIVIAVGYSGLIMGVFPQDTNVSWEGHLSGAIVGVFWAYAYRKTLRTSSDYR